MDINEVATVVRQHFLQKGTYLPTIFAELDGAEIEVLVLPQLKEKWYSIPKRARILFDAGRNFGQKTEQRQQSVTGLCMAYRAVSQDSHTKGLLVFKMREQNRLTCTTRFYEVRRDGSEIGVSLLEDPLLSGEGMVSPLLAAFMMGVVTVHRHQSASEGRRMLLAILSAYERIIQGEGCDERHQDHSSPR